MRTLKIKYRKLKKADFKLIIKIKVISVITKIRRKIKIWISLSINIKNIKLYLSGGFGNILFQLFYGKILEENYIVQYVDYLTKKNLITSLAGWTIHKNIFHYLHLYEYSSSPSFFEIYFIVLIKKSKKIQFQMV